MKNQTNGKESKSVVQLWSGKGTEVDPYQISTVEDLIILSQFVNKGNSTRSMYFLLKKDLDLKNVTDFIPIGGYNEDGVSINNNHGFQGKFDGNGKTISNLTIIKDTGYQKSTNISLFGLIKGESSSYAQIKNLGVTNVNLSGYTYVGALCADISYAQIEKVYATGKISAATVLGGLIANGNYSSIKNSYTDIEAKGIGGSEYDAVQQFLGGFFGSVNDGVSISNCHSLGYCEGCDIIGGFCGINGGTILECFTETASVVGNNTVGGFCGKNASKGTIDKCYASITRYIFANDYVGGFVGLNDNATINNSFSKVLKINSHDFSGGFCGKNDYPGTSMCNCYTTSEVLNNTGDSKFNGNFLGCKSMGAKLKNCYYDNTLERNNDLGTPKTPAEMKTADFVRLLNDGQSPAPWETDKAAPDLVNDGFPILDIQDKYITVNTLDAHQQGRVSVVFNGSYSEHFLNIKSKGFLTRNSILKDDWIDTPCRSDKFSEKIAMCEDSAFDYRAYVCGENGKVYYGDILTVITNP
jgi:hypothetical protein